MGLIDSYVHIRSQILMMNPIPSVGQAFAIISQEESHRNLSNVGSILGEAFYSLQDKKKRNSLHCEYCNWQGDTKSNCYKLIGYSEGHRFYKPPNKGWNNNYNKNSQPDKRKFDRNMANMTTVTNDTATQRNGPDFGFTPEQCTAILKLLETSSSTSVAFSVNMTGLMHWEDNGDW